MVMCHLYARTHTPSYIDIVVAVDVFLNRFCQPRAGKDGHSLRQRITTQPWLNVLFRCIRLFIAIPMFNPGDATRSTIICHFIFWRMAKDTENVPIPVTYLVLLYARCIAQMHDTRFIFSSERLLILLPSHGDRSGFAFKCVNNRRLLTLLYDNN